MGDMDEIGWGAVDLEPLLLEVSETKLPLRRFYGGEDAA